MRLAWVEVEHGDAAFEAEIDFHDAGKRVKRCAKNREIFALEIADGNYRGLGRGLRHGQVNLTEVAEHGNINVSSGVIRTAAFRKFSIVEMFIDSCPGAGGL